MKKEFKKRGFIFSGWGDVGSTYMLAKKPIHSLNDLKGLKVWAPVGDKMVKTVFQGFGIVPIYLEISQVLSAQRKGKIDAMFAPAAAMIGFQWNKKFKYMMLPSLTRYNLGCVISKKFFDSLNKKMQKILLQASEKHCVYSNALENSNIASIKALKKTGTKVLKLNKKAIKLFRKKCLWAADKLVQKKLLPKKLMKKVKKLRKQVH